MPFWFALVGYCIAGLMGAAVMFLIGAGIATLIDLWSGAL